LHCLDVDGHFDCPDPDAIPIPMQAILAMLFSGVLREQFFDLPFGYAAHFDAFYLASFAAQESNSGFGVFKRRAQRRRSRARSDSRFWPDCYVKEAYSGG
jgi:hypothetical protein